MWRLATTEHRSREGRHAAAHRCVCCVVFFASQLGLTALPRGRAGPLESDDGCLAVGGASARPPQYA